ncbi:MAG: NAD(P)/FAD-dependent oxidoreductase [Lachnospiraceae bacterium]|nr:NAD(P)/FAD-dependent oxidoreductase [Lachnospiraceae bacterium]
MKVYVIGAGAAGMMAAINAAEKGHEVTIIEKNEKLGKKLFITGKGRCNITNDCDRETFFDNVISNKKFLYSSIAGLDPRATEDFFERLGLKLKIERGNRVFPISDHSSDVISTLKKEIDRLGIKVMLNSELTDIKIIEDRYILVLNNKKEIEAQRVILCTGGRSYPSTGSDGGADHFGELLSIKHTKLEPSLVPLTVREEYVKKLQGLTLKNVELTLKVKDKILYNSLGELLFTHFGLSGPLVLSASCHLKEDETNGAKIYIDLKPALDEKKLDERLLSDFSKYSNKQFRNALSDLFPASLIPLMIELSDIDPYKQVNLVTKKEREKLRKLIKSLEFTVTGNRGFDEAIITRGGISIKEIDPKTMRLKKYEGIYVAGEMIDVDAYTGGFNLQIAWSTGALAGRSI